MHAIGRAGRIIQIMKRARTARMHAACYTNCLRGSFIHYCVVAAYKKYSDFTKAVGLDPHMNE